MTTEEKFELKDFGQTYVLRVSEKETNLPIDTAAELTKGFVLVNDLIGRLYREIYLEEHEDRSGNTRERTVVHPLLLKLVEERRKTLDQIFKMSGGEMIQEAGKETMKQYIKKIFEFSQDREVKEKYKDQVRKTIESQFEEKKC